MSAPKCPCDTEMDLVRVGDTGSGEAPDGGSYAVNIYFCDVCCTVARENVWDHPGVVFIPPTQEPA